MPRRAEIHAGGPVSTVHRDANLIGGPRNTARPPLARDAPSVHYVV
eukprot:CAMPEP_0184733496 /NCGR_PEP_ID=MMETSP0314-20130426/57615_1 /TAXON_ID=38298 /ORGANISM="Rhodella maculata, Strain CCMP 736" /LENGTH=45 /DNA_ID= /DNA_START= /DNA_END= /DNA_ORIENTATION=